MDGVTQIYGKEINEHVNNLLQKHESEIVAFLELKNSQESSQESSPETSSINSTENSTKKKSTKKPLPANKKSKFGVSLKEISKFELPDEKPLAPKRKTYPTRIVNSSVAALAPSMLSSRKASPVKPESVTVSSQPEFQILVPDNKPKIKGLGYQTHVWLGLNYLITFEYAEKQYVASIKEKFFPEKTELTKVKKL